MIRILECFAGIGGSALAWHRAGAEHVGLVEREPYARRVLARHWPDVPQWSDVRDVADIAAALRGRVDVLSGGPPCQPVSSAGTRRGTDDDRWLWPAFIDLAVAVEAPIIVAENPPALLTAQAGDAFAAVLAVLAAAGYSVEWDCISAGYAGAPHLRERTWIVARRDGGAWAFGDVIAESRAHARRRWPYAGRFAAGVLTRSGRRWPTPRPLPWEVEDGVDVLRRALPTPRAEDGESSGIRHSRGVADTLTAVVRTRLPTPTATDAKDRDYQMSGGAISPTLGHAAKTAAGVESQMVRRALPTPAARDYRDPNSAESQDRRNADSARGQQLPNHLADAGVLPRGSGPKLAPDLPEWMMGMPLGWSRPDGPCLADAPALPWLPDLTAELALTTDREHRRPRLKGIGNSVCVPVAEIIARLVLDTVPSEHSC